MLYRTKIWPSIIQTGNENSSKHFIAVTIHKARENKLLNTLYANFYALCFKKYINTNILTQRKLLVT